MKKNFKPWLLLLGAALLISVDARAADLVWIGGTGDWDAAANWSPAQVPTAADAAFITNSGNYTVTLPAGGSGIAGSLSVGGSSGTQILAIDRATLTLGSTSVINANGELDLLVAKSVLAGAANLTVNGTLNLANGTMSGSGTTTISSVGSLIIGSGGVTLDRPVTNGGVGVWSGGNLSIFAGIVFNNLATATFDITAAGRLSGTGTTLINNAGLFRQSAATASTVITSPFNNSGTVQVLAGSLSLSDGGLHTGTFSASPGATIDLGGGGHVLAPGSQIVAGSLVTLSGAATLSADCLFAAGSTFSVLSGVATLGAGCDVSQAILRIDGAKSVVNYNNAGSVAEVTITQGLLGGTSPVTVTGLLTLGGGTVTNSLITANGGLIINGNATLDGAKLINPVSAVWSAGSLSGANSAAITNLLGATFVNTFDGNIATGAGVTPVFFNAGVFAKTNGTAAQGTTSIDFQFINTGTVEVQTNTLRYAANQQMAGLTLLDGGGLSAQAQPLQLLGGTLRGTGPVAVANTQNLINSATVNPGLPLGELDVSGNYQQTASGVLNIELGGYSAGTSFDVVTVSAGGAGGVATLGGTLNVTLLNGFSPTNGATFTFLTAVSRAGAFATFNYPSNDLGMQVSYDSTSAKVTVSNLKPVVTIPIVDPAPVAYGSTLNFQFPAGTFIDPDGDQLTYSAAGMPPGITFSGSTRTFSGTPTQAGTFPVTVSASDGGIPTLTATNTFNIIITPATLAVTAQAKTKTYGAVDPSLTFAVSGLQFTDIQGSVLTGALTRTAGESVAGGPYMIAQGTLTANGNYTIIFTSSTLTITPMALTVTAETKTKTYGSADPAVTFTVSGLQFNDTQDSVLSGTPTRAAGETVAGGSYAITQGTLVANANYTLNFAGTALGITPATLTITAQSQTKTYGAIDPALTYTVSGLQFSDTQGSVLTGAPTRAAGETVAGSPYAITQGTLAANANYTVSFTGNTLAITPATLAVTAQSQTKTYGAADPAPTFTVTGLQFNDTQASVLTGTPTRAAGETVAGGPYAITQGTLVANANYKISFGGTALGITPATLTITAQPQTKTYGAIDPALTFTVSGLQFADTQASVLAGALARTAGETVSGSPYGITQSTLGADANYTIAFTGNTLTVTPAMLTVTAQAKTKTYGSADPALTFTVSGLQFNDTQASVFSGTPTRATGETVAGSPYEIAQGTLAASPNYTVSFTSSTLAIVPASLSIVADSKTKISGAADPVFTVVYLGFVNADSTTVLSGTLVITRAPGENPGNYQVAPSGLSSANYSITFVPGTLTIIGAPSQAALTISTSNQTNLLLSWNAVSNVTYRIQFKSDLNAPNWIDLAGDVLASASAASKTDTIGATNRYYRIRELP